MKLTEKQKQHVFSALFGLSVLPIFLIVKDGLATISNWSQAELYISTILGYFGIVTLLWMYILGSKSVIGLFFDDQARMRSIHKRLGKYGTLLIFLHPVMAAVSYGYNFVTYTLLPDFSSHFEIYVTFGRCALYALILLWVTSALLRSKIAYRPWKYTHYLAYIALPLALLHIPIVGSSFAQERLAQLYYFSILGLFILFSILRIRQLFGLGKVRYTVVTHNQATADVMVLTLRPSVQRAITSQRGQFIYLQTNLLGEEHPFSVLHNNVKTGELMVAYKKFGRFTKNLARLDNDSIVYVDGPYGTFTEQVLSRPTEPTVFIAGGIGITPFVDHVLTSESAWLFYANQTEQSSVFGKAFKEKLGDRYVPIISNDPNSQSEKGYVRPELFTKYLAQPTAYRYFVCGPPKMMEVTKIALLSLGVPAEKIYSEDFSF